MQSYRTINRLCGWVVFIAAAVVYTLTLESSASFWDCPEFITSAARLEVGHPPGAPFFMLLGNLFSHMAPDVSGIAWCINFMNGLFSAACVMLLFHTITALLRRLVADGAGMPSRWQTASIMAGGLTGALAYAFSDTFWYSAVESEVYACSSFFTALTFWSILKWDDCHGSPSADRWLVFIAYLVGLSVGVHLLNLLCIPAIGLFCYYRLAVRPTLKGSLLAFLLSTAVVAFVLWGVVPGIMKMAGYFDLFVVNTVGLPYNSGTLVYGISLLAGTVGCIGIAMRGQNRLLMAVAVAVTLVLCGVTLQTTITSTLLSTLVLLFFVWFALRRYWRLAPHATWHTLRIAACALFVLVVGYSSYTVILVRASDNPPMNQQACDNPFALQSYLGREQYGDKPLLYGQTYCSPHALVQNGNTLRYDFTEGAPVYRRQQQVTGDDAPRYVETGRKMDYRYEPQTCMWFPRMHSADHAAQYRQWVGEPSGRTVRYFDLQTDSWRTTVIPSYKDNLKFFLRYQVNFMYWRYFLWNFVGRQNDRQGHGDNQNGNWLTGITPLDRWIGHDPDSGADSKGRNVYYALPLLLGLLGIVWQTRQGKAGQRQFNVIALLFFMTGLAIIIYLNDTPRQPRERDYVFAGSFYAFSIWIGMGATAVIRGLRRRMKPAVALAAGSVASLAIPIQMAGQNWDDHDRSGRTLCRDMGQNYLNSTQKDGCPILFVNGDNDTFPVWYNTEVEQVRPDVRVCNLMYLHGGIYAAQMQQPAYTAPGLPYTIPKAFYRDGVNDFVRVNPVIGTENGQPVTLKSEIENIYRARPAEKPFGDDPFEWKNIVRYWLTSDEPSMRCIPTDEIHIPVDKEAVARSGMLVPEGVEIPDTMTIRINDRAYLGRAALLLVDMIAGANWERPLYVAVTVGLDEYIDLSGFLLQEGMAYRIVPYDVRKAGILMDTDKTYDCVMHRFRYGGLDNPGLYLDDTNRNMAVLLQNLHIMLAAELCNKQQYEKAKAVLDRCRQEIRNETLYKDGRHAYGQMEGLYRLIGKAQNASNNKNEKNHEKEL